jgi:hypothetical protein
MTPISYTIEFGLFLSTFLPEHLVDGSTIERWFYWANKECE